MIFDRKEYIEWGKNNLNRPLPDGMDDAPPKETISPVQHEARDKMKEKAIEIAKEYWAVKEPMKVVVKKIRERLEGEGMKPPQSPKIRDWIVTIYPKMRRGRPRTRK